VESPAGDTVAYSYDLFGRPSKTERTINGQLYESKIDYDNKGRAYKLTYPQPAGLGAFVAQYNFDAHGHVIAVRDALTQNPYWKLLATDSAGRPTEEEFGNQAAKTTRAYFEEKERVKSILTVAGGKTVQNLAYFYDKRLNLLSRTDARQGKTEIFSYDLLDRLRSAKFLPGFGRPTTYAYSPGGDLVKKSDVGVFTYHPFRPHILTTVAGDLIGHDAVGNQTSRPGVAITYTAFDLPSSVTRDGFGTATFSYDGHQQRIRKVTPLAETVYVGDLYERVTPADPTQPVEHRYSIYNGERLVASVTRKSGALDETRYVHSDHLGSIDVLTDDPDVNVLGVVPGDSVWIRCRLLLIPRGIDIFEGIIAHVREWIPALAVARLGDDRVGSQKAPEPRIHQAALHIDEAEILVPLMPCEAFGRPRGRRRRLP
jgi:hypothetical protein